jgi:hypothetical protein
MKIHGLESFFDTKIVYFSQVCDNFCQNSLNKNMKNFM